MAYSTGQTTNHQTYWLALANSPRTSWRADALDGGPGADRLHGKTQNGTLSGGRGTDTLRGNVGDDRLFGAWGDGSLTSGGAHFLQGGEHADTCSPGPLITRCET